jgi:uncharacterized protein YndB with AHSA1/START domain
MPILTRYINGHAIRRLCLTKIFEASQDLVFEAWTSKTHLPHWWGPYGFSNPVCEADPHPGGELLIHMQAADGLIFPMHGIYHQVHKPIMIIFSSLAFEDDEGYGGFENLNTVLLTPWEGKTRLTFEALITKASVEADAALEGMEEGWKQSLEKLEVYLSCQSKTNLKRTIWQR